jgi:hypothetical protein
MCPVCISTTALMVAGASSTGGIGALMAKIFLVKRRKGKSAPMTMARRCESESARERNDQ